MAAKHADSISSGRILNLWLPVTACMAVIFYASSLPGKDIPSLFSYQDILFHGGIYAILALFFLRAIGKTSRHRAPARLIILTVLFCALYGASDEFHQLFTPGRSCDAFDLMVDTIGASIGSVTGGFFFQWLTFAPLTHSSTTRKK